MNRDSRASVSLHDTTSPANMEQDSSPPQKSYALSSDAGTFHHPALPRQFRDPSCHARSRDSMFFPCCTCFQHFRDYQVLKERPPHGGPVHTALSCTQDKFPADCQLYSQSARIPISQFDRVSGVFKTQSFTRVAISVSSLVSRRNSIRADRLFHEAEC